MSDTPSGRIISAANVKKSTTDANGRVLEYRRLGALDRARLFKAIGAFNATNAPYLGMAMLAASVTSIDKVPTIFPTRDAEIEAAIAKLDDVGLDAVATALALELMPIPTTEEETVSADQPVPDAASPT